MEYNDVGLANNLKDELNKNNPTLAVIHAIKQYTIEEQKQLAELAADELNSQTAIYKLMDIYTSDADIQKQLNTKTPTTVKTPKVETPKISDPRIEQLNQLKKKLEELKVQYDSLDSPGGKGLILVDIANTELAIKDLEHVKFSIEEIYKEYLKLKEENIDIKGIEELELKLKQLGVTFEETKKEVTKTVDTTDYYGNLMSETEKLNSMVKEQLMNSFYQLGTAIGGTFGQVVSLMSMTIQSVSTVISILEQAKVVQASQLALTKSQTVAESELALTKAGSAAAGAASSVASVPFIGPILAVAAIATVMSALLPLLSKHASGGIIGGNSIVGDKQLIRVNSGEMVLNQQQQSNLFAQLHGQELTYTGNNYRFRIEGSDLIAVLDNYNKKHK
jgi:hypothetical protein